MLSGRLPGPTALMPLDARVTSFREIRWQALRPNAMILLSPGEIEAAPAMYVASARVPEAADRQALSSELVALHGNLTVIDAAVGDDRKQGSTWVPLQAILIERHGGDAFEPPYAASPAEYEQALCLLASRLEDALRYIRENPESWKELAQRYNVSPEKI